MIADVVHLARTVYEAANYTHLSELLSERKGLDMGRTTLRRILVNAGLSSPRRRRPPKHRVRRQRMPRKSMLIQLDGSYHRWLGEDGPQFTILFAVDDAAGCVPGALFCDHEDTSSYFLLMQGTTSATPWLLEENALTRYINHFNLSQSQLDAHGVHTSLIKAAVLREIAEGMVPDRQHLTGNVPLNLMKSEKLFWVMDDVDYIETVVRRERRGSSQGL